MENSNENLILGMRPNVYAGLMNLSCLLPSCGWIVAIVVWGIGKKHSSCIDEMGKNMINWMITSVILSVCLVVLIWMLKFSAIALLLSGVLAGYLIVCPIVAAVKAFNEERWEYPLTMKFIK